jgi:hypothetical protein
MKASCLFTLFLFLSAAPALAQPVSDTLWTRTYGGIGEDVARSVQQAADAGYIVAGNTESFGAGDYDLLSGEGDRFIPLSTIS